MDYYEILEIARTATPKDIKAAYKKLAILYHPDKNPGCDITIFAEISNAYNTLSDPIKRKSYDMDINNLFKFNRRKTTTRSKTRQGNSYSYGPTNHRRKADTAYAAKKGMDDHNDFFNEKSSGSQVPFGYQDPYEAVFGTNNPRYMPTVPLGRNDKQPGRTIPSYAKTIFLPSQIDLPPARYGYMPQFDPDTGRGWWAKMTKREYMMEEDEYAWDAFHDENDNRHRLQEEWEKSN